MIAKVLAQTMDAASASLFVDNPPFPRGLIGTLKGDVARQVVAAGGDVAMVIDREGVIRDMALSNAAMARAGAASWLDRPWSDTVTIDSKHKVDELLRDALSAGASRWREVNQITPENDSLMVRYLTVDAGQSGHVIAIGRDDRATAAMQQRLVEAQQAMERDYTKLRDTEFRYRLLFRMSGEAVIVVDAANRRVVEANPAAEKLIAGPRSGLVGEPFVKLFAPASQEDAASLLAVVQSTARTSSHEMRLSGPQGDFLVSASLFRQDRAPRYLMRLAPAEKPAAPAGEAGLHLHAVLEQIPDAFLVTDTSLKILAANTTFLDLVRIATKEQATGQFLSRFLGRAGMSRNILVDNLRAHGSVRNFRTVLRNQFEDEEDVEVSAVAVPGSPEPCYGFTIRAIGRRSTERAPTGPDLHRSVEKLTELVGRVTLKELVRETTDLVERLCIEAALELTKNNRASAAEVLGLSRQSLYSKLHRFDLGNLQGGDES